MRPRDGSKIDADSYLSSLDRIASTRWQPSDDDLLRLRIATLGAEEFVLQVAPQRYFRLIDIAGARGTKQKWAPYCPS